MKFTVDREDLKARVAWIAKAATSRGGDVVLIKLGVEGDSLFLEGSDGTYWRKTQMPLLGSDNIEGFAFTPIAQLSRILIPGSAPQATFVVDDSSREITIFAGRSEFKLGLAIEPQGWEEMPAVKEVARANRENILWALRTAGAGAATAAEKGKSDLMGVQIEIEADKMVFAATNGYRMIRTRVDAVGIETGSLTTLPAHLIDAIQVILGPDVTFVTTELGLFGVADAKTSAVSLRMAVKPPPIQKILNGGQQLVEGTTLDSAEFVEALQVVDATGLPHVRLDTDSGEMVITSEAPSSDTRRDAVSSTTIPMIGEAGLGFAMTASVVKPLFTALRTDQMIIKRDSSSMKNPVFVYEDGEHLPGTTYEACFMPIVDTKRAA